MAIAFTILFIVYIFCAIWRNYSGPQDVDFQSFWAAGQLVLKGTPELAYDIPRHRAVELTVGPVGLLPFPYPPPFLFFVAPFGFQPFWLAFGGWVSANAALYLFTMRSVLRPPWPLIHPAAHVNVLIGQNGLLTTSLLVAGANQLAVRPLLGGLILGLLVIKPQLGVLLPFALVAGREWRAFCGAALSSVGLLLAALLIFGLPSYAGFFAILPKYAGYMRENAWPWGELASVFAFARAVGIEPMVAMGIQGVAAVAALWITCRAWARRHKNRVAILAASTLLIPPYLLNYDSLLLIVPIGYLMQERWSRPVAFVVWLSCLSVLGTYLKVYTGPNTVTLGAVISLWFLYNDRLPFKARESDDRITPGPAPVALS